MSATATLEKTVEQEPIFLAKADLEKTPVGYKIEIPPGAKYYRLKSGEVLYFENKKESSRNGFKELPSNCTHMSFPEFQRKFSFIQYGTPEFYTR